MKNRFAAACAVAIALTSMVSAQTASLPRNMTPADYKGWEAIVGESISHDGHWLAYQTAVTDSDGFLTIKNNDDPRNWKTPNATNADFTEDSKWCGYLIHPPREVADRLREEHKPIETRFGLRDLESGEERIVEGVQSFQFLKDGKTVIVHRSRGTVKPEGGSDLLEINLANGRNLTIGNVSEAVPNRAGTLIALAIESDSGDQGVQVLEPATGTLNSVEWGKPHVSRLVWAKNVDTLAFLMGKANEKKEGDEHRVAVASNSGGKLKLQIWDVAMAKTALPNDWRVSDGPIFLSPDGKRAAFGVAPWLDRHAPEKPGEKAHPEIWNSHDLRTVPEQRVQAGADKAKADLAVWNTVDDTFRKVGDGPLQHSRILEGGTRAIVTDTKPYASAATNGFSYHDVWAVDLLTGARTKVLEKTHWEPVASRTGRYLAYYEGKRWRIYDLEKGQRLDPFASQKVSFEDPLDDHTVPEKPPVDTPDWLAGDQGMVVATENDAYLVEPGKGEPIKLTADRTGNVTHRFTLVDDQEDGPPIDQPLWFSVLDQDTKQSGFYACDRHGKPLTRVMQDAKVDRLAKARDGDRFVFQMGTFEKSPNLFVTNQAFSAIKPETKTNLQMSQFAWGHTELVTYKSRWGALLHGVLIYPADYQRSHRYPMVTYIYERMSDNLHSFSGPNDANPYNAQIWSQDGYFVLLPDITYQGKRRPGLDAVDCLEPAVAAALAKAPAIDKDKVGLVGHSWGAYQTAFVTTVSKVFKVGVAGAPLTDLVSMYNTHYWNAGITNQVLLETSQGRLEVPFWEDPKAYIDNSPVWQSQKRTAPILITVGDQDGAVDYHQGIALYNTLRRLGKDCVLLVYYGENHNFTRRPDQLDYAHRLRHYLDVYLKGAKPEPWIESGVPFLKKDD